jgi:hypothetical protein
MLENRVLKRIFGSKRDEVEESGVNYIRKCLMIFSPHPIFSVNKIEKN